MPVLPSPWENLSHVSCCPVTQFVLGTTNRIVSSLVVSSIVQTLGQSSASQIEGRGFPKQQFI